MFRMSCVEVVMLQILNIFSVTFQGEVLLRVGPVLLLQGLREKQLQKRRINRSYMREIIVKPDTCQMDSLK